MSLLIKNGVILTQNASREVREGNIYIEDGIITEIGAVRTEADEVLDASHALVMPGLINAHNHVGMSLLRGYTDDLSLKDFLKRTNALKNRKTREFVRAGALVGCLEMLQSGTTTFLDIYFHEDEVATVVDELGMRALLGWGIVDPDKTKYQTDPFDAAKKFISRHRSHPRIEPLLAPHSPYMCSRSTLEAVKDYSIEAGLPIQTHVSETRKEVYDFEREHGQRPIEYLHSIDFLGPNLSIAHSVWVTLNEVKQLAETNTNVVHCPVSNMKLATGGVAPLPEMFEHSIAVGLGTDSCATNNNLDMFGVMKTCALLQKFHRWDPTTLKAQQTLDLATIDGARALGVDDHLGSIEEGKHADIIIVDLHATNLVPFSRAMIPSHIVYSCTGANVRDVIVEGRPIMRDHEVLTADPEEIIGFAEEVATKLELHYD